MRNVNRCLVVFSLAAIGSALPGCHSGAKPAAAPSASAPTSFDASAAHAVGAAPGRDFGVVSASDARTVTLVVHGMGCPLCANNVDKQLLKIPNVRAVNVDLGSGRVRVTMAPGAQPPARPQLARAVEHSGYTLVKVQTP